MGRVSSGKAAELCGMGRVEFLNAMSQAGIPVADLDDEEMARELRDA
jgi:predicted HTH domain antitoxin